jgi:hypothetical protein
MSHYPNFVNHDSLDYQNEVEIGDTGVDADSICQRSSNADFPNDAMDGDEEGVVFEDDEDEFSNVEEEVVCVTVEVKDDFSDDEFSVAKAEQSYVLDVNQLTTSVSSISAADYIEDVVVISPSDFRRDYFYDYEQRMEDWERHRGGEWRRKLRSQPPPLRSVESGFNDEEYEDKKGPSCLLMFTLFLLTLELGAAIVAVLFFEPFLECCGDSFVSTPDFTTDSWNQVLYGIAVAYLVWIIVAFPVVAISKEPVFLFNPMIGFLLCMHMLYVTNTTYAYAIYGLETLAMLGQTYVLMQLHRNTELCIHSMFNFIMCGLVVYSLIELTRQGGYCIVAGSVQGVFSEATCNVRCIDDASCNICDGNATQCFIPFQSIS